MNIPVFDLHCDTATALLSAAGNPTGELRRNEGHIDLERGSRLAGYVQCFACMSTSDMRSYNRSALSPMHFFEKTLDFILWQINKNGDLIKQAYNMSDVAQNRKKGLISAILTLEGTAGIGHDPALLQDLYNIGFRIVSLGWNEKNPLAGSHITGGGLTDLGRAFVKEAQAVGLLIDVSHVSDEAFWDIIQITQAPVVATHSNSRSVRNVSRNLTDDMFRAICRTGGIVGINQYAAFIGGDPTIDTVCNHFLHFLELDPSGKHIGLGGDFDGCEALARDFFGIQDYPKLADKLLDCGLTQNMLEDIFWNNAIGVMEQCCT